jgi:hypothetical protein
MSLNEFKKRFRASFAKERKLHSDAALLLEPAVVAARPHPEAAHLALDMLFVQAYKSHLSVLAVGELGHMEDAATLTRRLLELAASSGYILALDNPREREPRAKRYLAALWLDLDDAAKAHLPQEVRTQWSVLTAGVARGGLPGLQKMLGILEQQGTYDDYRLLSSIAHGGASDQIMAYSDSPVRVRDTLHCGSLLVYSSRYYLATAVAWNSLYGRLNIIALEDLIRRIDKWTAIASGEAPAPEAA